jgi:soluble lytic murein transglycosylase-like protein
MKTMFYPLIALIITLQPLAATVPNCEALAEQAARQSGVPEGLLSAIARVESGRTTNQSFRAWPWTLNQAGQGSFHASEQEALKALDTALATGRRNVDVGCMQINVRWHEQAFSDLQAMIDPVQNTEYAARYLRDLYDRFGDWTLAVMNYHSSDPERGKAYAARVMRQIGMTTETAAAPPPPAAPDVQVMRRSGLLIASPRALVALDEGAVSKQQIVGKESWALFAKTGAD